MPKTNGQYQAKSFFVRVLTDDGLITGVSNFNSDFSVTPEEAFFQIPAGFIYEITELQITVGAASKIDQLDYGDIAPAGINNGIDIRAAIGGADISLLQKIIMNNNDLVNFGGSISSQVVDFAGTSDTITTSFNAAAFTPGIIDSSLRLNGDRGDRIRVVLNDDFSSLNLHEFFIRGWV